MKVAGWCEAHYVDLMPHNPLGPICVAASVHLAAAVPNFSWMEIRSSPTEELGFYDEEIFPVQCVQQGPRVLVPDTPGLGVEVDEARAVALGYQPRPSRHLRRRDGSITNS
jgi:galactonate dehydratase